MKLKMSQRPWYFDLACKRIAAGKKGGYRLLDLYKRLGLLDKYCYFPLPRGERALFPLTWPGIEREEALESYETDALQTVVDEMKVADMKFVLIDCGADIGIYSRLLLGVTGQIQHAVAFEPNPEAFRILEKNLDDIGIECRLFEAAVGSRRGNGELIFPEEDPISHAGYMHHNDQGAIDIVPIDVLDIPTDLGVMLKLDVEGAEYDALLGAESTLRNAPCFVVQLEAHRRVARRTGREPVDGVKLLRQIAGEVRWVACNEAQGKIYTDLNLEQPLFEQLPTGDVYDLVVSSVNEK